MEGTISLKVREALTKDTGRNIVRIDPEDMLKLGVSIGEIILLEGKASAPAKVMPCFPEERGKGIVQMDGLLRDNLQTTLEKKVTLQKVKASPAQSISLQAVGKGLFGKADRSGEYLCSLLEGIPVKEGNLVRAKLFGSGQLDFLVAQTQPAGVVYITGNTRVKLKDQGQGQAAKGRVSYEDIGGLGQQVKKIREMIELPLSYPQVFEKLGISAPKGVLLSGPPGTGKTLIARAVANETNCYFVSISGPEIMGKLYGESESRIRKIFEDARKNAPAIIFIDEIDSIAPKRENISEEKQVERRVVAQLLALMDGLESRGQVIVIAATNLPDAIDPALRRPGRFDRELNIPVPDINGRKEILLIHTAGMPLAADVDIDQLAGMTHGFVGTDLEALAREAAMCTIRKILPSIDFESGVLPVEQLQELEVSMADFLEAMKDTEPSAIREFFVDVPNVPWETVGGLDVVKDELRQALEWPLKYGQWFEEAGIRPPKGILLHGPPGTGKTLLAKAAASQTGMNFIAVKGSSLMSKYIGDSEKAVREVFKKARQAAPTLLFFDEIDAVLPARQSQLSGTEDRVIGQFLAEMDGIDEMKGVFVLGATNRMEILDPAILRSGRFDLILEIPAPDLEARLAIMQIHAKAKPVAPDIDWETLARATEELSGADLELMIQKAAFYALQEIVKSGRQELLIETAHLQQALEFIKAKTLKRFKATIKLVT
jgi:transitional endoplasmic reticulum ATPase